MRGPRHRPAVLHSAAASHRSGISAILRRRGDEMEKDGGRSIMQRHLPRAPATNLVRLLRSARTQEGVLPPLGQTCQLRTYHSRHVRLLGHEHVRAHMRWR